MLSFQTALLWSWWCFDIHIICSELLCQNNTYISLLPLPHLCQKWKALEWSLTFSHSTKQSRIHSSCYFTWWQKQRKLPKQCAFLTKHENGKSQTLWVSHFNNTLFSQAMKFNVLLYVTVGRLWCLQAGTRGRSSPRIHSMGWPVDLL